MEGIIPYKQSMNVLNMLYKTIFQSKLMNQQRNLTHQNFTYIHGKPLGSGWYQKSIEKVCVDIHQIKEPRAPSYIEIPTKFKSPKFGLVTLHNIGDNELVKLCAFYHQREKSNHVIQAMCMEEYTRLFYLQGINFRRHMMIAFVKIYKMCYCL